MGSDKGNLEEQISNDVQTTKANQSKIAKDLFGNKSPSEVTLEDLVLGVNQINSQQKMLSKTFQIINENFEATSKLGQNTSRTVNELQERFTELKDKTIKSPRPMENNIANTEEIVAEVVTKMNDESADYSLDQKVKKAMKKHKKSNFYLLLLVIVLLIVLIVGRDNFSKLLTPKNFNSLSATEEVKEDNKKEQEKKEKKKQNPMYEIPIKATFTCDGKNKEFLTPKVIRSRGIVRGDTLNFTLRNKGEEYSCYTKQFKEL